MNMRARIRKNESGMASLVIAILIVIIVTTIVLGFMQIIRREQRRSLDNQLSSQAYYAAESGVNDAMKAIRQQGFTADKTTCGPLASPGPLSGTSNRLTSDGNIQYSCLLIDQSPPTVTFDSISTTHSNVFPLKNNAGSIKSLMFTWQSPDTVPNKTRNPGFVFPPAGTLAGQWDSLGLLRVDIMPASSVDRASLITNQRTYFMYPTVGGGPITTVGYGLPSSSGAILDGKCSNGTGSNTSHVCNVIINGLGGIAGPIYVRVLAMYNPVKLTITGTDASGPIGLSGAQTLVDSTGKAADVLRRIQVRVPFQDADLPDYAIASMDSLCKKFVANPDGSVVSEALGDLTCDPNQ
jgi:Tfp pilus assembly protein PilX